MDGAMYAVDGAAIRADTRARLLDGGDPDFFRFKRLPLVAVKSRHAWASHPPEGLQRVQCSEDDYAVTWCVNRALLEADHLARTRAPNGNRWVCDLTDASQMPYLHDPTEGVVGWLPLSTMTPLAFPAALNLSLQTSPGRPLPVDHVLRATTRTAAARMPVVVAAGNWGAYGDGTLSALATLPWTIAVGACSDEGGTTLHPTSSSGTRGAVDESGVTVVAYGENSAEPGTFGTSFAAPRVVRLVLTVTAFLLQLRSLRDTRRLGTLAGVPLPLAIVVDQGFDDYDPRPPHPIPMLPQVGVDVAAVREAVEILERCGVGDVLDVRPDTVREIVVSSARPVPGHEASQVGAGFVDEATVFARLTALSAWELVVLAGHETAITASDERRLRAIQLADATLPLLFTLSTSSSMLIGMDMDTGHLHAPMRHPGLDGTTGDWVVEPTDVQWPPPLLDGSTRRLSS